MAGSIAGFTWKKGPRPEASYRGARRNAPRKNRLAILTAKRALKASLGLGKHDRLPAAR